MGRSVNNPLAQVLGDTQQGAEKAEAETEPPALEWERQRKKNKSQKREVEGWDPILTDEPLPPPVNYHYPVLPFN